VSYPIVEHRPTLGGLETRALELDGEGPTLLLLHGYADSADTWRPVLDRVRRRGRAAVALDMPGFGTAARLDREGEILPQLDAFLAEAVGRWSGGRGVVIVGNSLGGVVAMRAAQNPELAVAAVIPVAPAGLDMPSWFAIVEGAELLRLVLASPVPLPEAVVRQAVGRVYRLLAFARPRQVDPAIVAAFTSHVRSKRDVSRILAIGRRLRIELADCFRLEQIECPVLMLWGDRDRMVYASGAERVLNEVAGSRLEMIENCGHCPQLEQPDRLVELMLAFPSEGERASGDRVAGADAA
jgi:pimeloyl-ACP methyl ester carboxylesterase